MSSKENITNFDNLSIDEVLINLKIIGHIKKNQKLSIAEKLLDVDKYPFFQPLFRWINNDNRYDTINFLSYLLIEAERHTNELIDDIKKYKKEQHEEITKMHSEKLLTSVRDELNNAKQGLLNIKNTYNDNPKVKYTLERLSEKFSLAIEKIDLFYSNLEKKKQKIKN
jgi:hypothetical protein